MKSSLLVFLLFQIFSLITSSSVTETVLESSQDMPRSISELISMAHFDPETTALLSEFLHRPEEGFVSPVFHELLLKPIPRINNPVYQGIPSLSLRIRAEMLAKATLRFWHSDRFIDRFLARVCFILAHEILFYYKFNSVQGIDWAIALLVPLLDEIMPVCEDESSMSLFSELNMALQFEELSVKYNYLLEWLSKQPETQISPDEAADLCFYAAGTIAEDDRCLQKLSIPEAIALGNCIKLEALEERK